MLITANGSRNLVSMQETSFRIGPIESRDVKYKISQALVMNSLPSIGQNFPIPSNLCSFKITADLFKTNKFPKVTDSDLHLIIGIREDELNNFEKIRKPSNSNEPFVGLCKLGWTVFGPDQYLNNKPMTRCNFVRISDDILEKKVDLLLHESFVEKPHDLIKHHRQMIKSC